MPYIQKIEMPLLEVFGAMREDHHVSSHSHNPHPLQHAHEEQLDDEYELQFTT